MLILSGRRSPIQANRWLAGLILLSLTLSLILPGAAKAAVWTLTGSMQKPRWFHTSTLLPNGKVLVAGGYSGHSFQSSAELYDPATETWTSTSFMLNHRGYHTATLLPNGKVMVVGGLNNLSGQTAYLSSAELYDPATETWEAIGSMQEARARHTATLLSNGKILVAGGDNKLSGQITVTHLSSAELNDPATGTWEVTGSMQEGRIYHHTATLLPNGQVLVAGSFSNYRNTELYNPDTGTWTGTELLIIPRYTHTAVLLPSGKVQVAGGKHFYDREAPCNTDTELYDRNTETWIAGGCMVNARAQHTGTLLTDGRVLVTGGYYERYLSSAEVYTPAKGWKSTPTSMQYSRFGHTATLLPNGKVLVAGGKENLDTIYVLSTAELFDPAAADLSISKTSLTPTCMQGQDAASQSFEVWNSWEGTLSYNISQDAAWLTCTPASGASTGEHDSITVNYTTSGLAAGTYNATITVSGASQTKTIAVTLTVSVPPIPPILSVSRTSLSPSCQPGQNATSQGFEVWNSVGSTLNYNISQDAAWLSCTPDSGASTGEHDAITVNYATSGLAAGSYNATITITGASQTKTIAVTLTVASVHLITASTGAHGSISPAGEVAVNHGADQTFAITPDAGYHVADVLVDGNSVGAVAGYTFTNVTADHTIAASFALNTYTITAVARPGGSISPAGTVQVNHGDSQGFTINPDTDFSIKTVLVDGVSVGPVPSYTFENISENHTIRASFVATIIYIFTDQDQVMVPPGKTAPLQVKLSNNPLRNVTVTIAWKSGSPALSIQGTATLTFTRNNWNTYQTVLIAATPGQDNMNSAAVFELSSPGLTGKQITAVKNEEGNISPLLNLLLDD